MALYFRYCSLYKFSLTNKISITSPNLNWSFSEKIRGSMEQKVETPREKPQERGSVFSMTKVNTEIIVPRYILITWKKVIKMHRKMKKKSLFSVLYINTHIYTHLNAAVSLKYCIQY